MDITEKQFLELLNMGESQKVEFKAAKSAFPKDALKTICAFSNTNNGLLILGVSEDDKKRFYVSGVQDTNKVIDDLFSVLNNTNKVNKNVINEKDVTIKSFEGKDIIIIPVRKVHYKDKPIFLNGNISQSFYRQGTGDFRCSQETINAMLRDSGNESFDSTVITDFTIDDLDTETVNKYIDKFKTVSEDHPFLKLSNEEFLVKINALRVNRETGTLSPTVAGLLVFGKHTSIKEYIPHYSIEYIYKESSANNSFKDRVIYDGIWGEDNLFNFFFYVIDKMYLTLQNTSELSSDSITRKGVSKLRVALREAFVNSLIHGDYKSDKGVLIIRYANRFIFSNGGTLRIDPQDFFSGAHSDPRNYLIQEMFRFINLCEKAGTGIPKIMEAVQDYSLKYPNLDVDIDSVELTLWDTSIIESLNISHPLEKRIVEYLIQNKIASRKDLEQDLSTPKNTILKYLKILENKGIIGKSKDGRQFLYYISQNNKNEFRKYNHLESMYALLEEIKRREKL
ncbi:RNA-binding domain-containing protein [Lactococcus sp. DD01]|uniref:RNA-binding domain-containing protein n=1 Tax=Lactococcus sp. DD01 TaxID=1776443 RepID=UPI00077638DB|nr:RNA-binding domain-containing protein [Lactococcus sp. DD01]KXT61042.1 ATP-dependent DNA helicase recG [Lactococcus sp. DD01]